MKKIISSLAFSLFVLRTSAEVFIAPSNAVVFLTVPTNQTMLISSLKTGDFGGGSFGSLRGLFVQAGVTNTILFTDANGMTFQSGGPYALNGPCQIAFVGETIGNTEQPAPVVVSYNLLQNSLLHSVIVTPGSTNVISVPAGKRVRFLAHTYSMAYSDRFDIQNGTNTVLGVVINNGDEFTGPVTIMRGLDEYESYSELISYYFTDDFFVVPDTGYISGPSGSFEIAVEKSLDLAAWSPVVVYNTGSDQKAFYRLRIQK